jgi:hypothetical protein
VTTAAHADARRRRKAPAVALSRPVVVHNEDVAATFDEMAELLAIQGANACRCWSLTD